MKNNIFINGEEYKILFSEAKIRSRIREMAQEIKNSTNFTEPPILIFIITGGLYFGVDLSRELDRIGFIHHVDTISLKSYSGEQGGEVRLVSEPHASIRGRDIIIVEDIIDRGDSMNFLEGYLTALRPSSIRYCTLLLKRNHGPLHFTVDYCGFEIDSGWIGGYGMDLDQTSRGLLFIAMKVR